MPPRKPQKPGKYARRSPKAQLREVARDGGSVHPPVVSELMAGKSELRFTQEAVRGSRVSQQRHLSRDAKRRRILFILQGLINIAEGRKGNPNEQKGGMRKINGEWVRVPASQDEKKSPKRVSPTAAKRILQKYGLYDPAVMNQRNSTFASQIGNLLKEIKAANAIEGRPPGIHSIDRKSRPRGQMTPRQSAINQIKFHLSNGKRLDSRMLKAIAKQNHLSYQEVMGFYRSALGRTR
ncbi:MAG: hypothetical protein IPJ89_03630 [Candidatus Iainarchaeum archaeon]|uniref:Uncharacterized protein n=1 Tax=Candidatus Iainarchaeum sp. TaxID=3101447 RepID=A0A7T9I213_9ARCH|nr:MAG: hypothetical protein IPJ89_03630 [Candidatus Diapherotrites archaeon]